MYLDTHGSAVWLALPSSCLPDNLESLCRTALRLFVRMIEESLHECYTVVSLLFRCSTVESGASGRNSIAGLGKNCGRV
jgi:hypothetical protein